MHWTDSDSYYTAENSEKITVAGRQIRGLFTNCTFIYKIGGTSILFDPYLNFGVVCSHHSDWVVIYAGYN